MRRNGVKIFSTLVLMLFLFRNAASYALTTGTQNTSTLMTENRNPNPPEITGPPTGKSDKIYNYNFLLTDPDGDSLTAIQIEWGGTGAGNRPTSAGPAAAAINQMEQYLSNPIAGHTLVRSPFAQKSGTHQIMKATGEPSPSRCPTPIISHPHHSGKDSLNDSPMHSQSCDISWDTKNPFSFLLLTSQNLLVTSPKILF